MINWIKRFINNQKNKKLANLYKEAYYAGILNVPSTIFSKYEPSKAEEYFYTSNAYEYKIKNLFSDLDRLIEEFDKKQPNVLAHSSQTIVDCLKKLKNSKKYA